MSETPTKAANPANVCGVCQHVERARIEAARANGASFRVLGERFGLHRDQLWRHFGRHVTPERKAALMLGEAKIDELTNAAAAESRTLLERMNVACSLLFNRLVVCAENADDDGVSKIAGRLNVLFRQFAELTGELRQASTVHITNNSVNIIASPEFVRLQSGLLAIARQHPDVRGAIVDLLRSLDAKPSTPAGAPLIEHEGASDAA